MKIQTGFTGFFRMDRIVLTPEKSCKSPLNFLGVIENANCEVQRRTWNT
jgi:hypothetical protein